MAERYEPKVAVRPLSERKPGAPASGEADPLFELTRMVTGRSTFDPPPSAKNKTVPAAGPTVASNAALANDLESELMNDLQASFAMVREPPPPPPPAPTPQPAPVAARPQPTPAARPQAPAAPPITSEVAPPPARPAPRTPAPPAPVAPARAERAPQPASPQTLADKPSFFRSGSGPTVDLSHIQMRPTTPAAPPHAPEAPPVRASSSRWNAPDEDKAGTEAPSRFAPPRASAAAFRPDAKAAEAELDEGLDDALLGEEPYPDDFALEDMAPLPEYAEGEEELPPFPEDELAGLSRRRTNRALIIAGAVVAVAIAGGLGYAMLGDTGSTGTPPIITADATPTKVPPAEPAAGTEVAKESYDRVDAADNTGDAKLVTPSDGQIAALPAEENANNAISRVIVPAGPGFDAPIADDSGTPAADASDGTDASSIGPKKVRTVVVRPDGTIVSSEAAPADGTAPADASAPADAAAAEATPAPVETAEAPPSTTAGSDMDKVIDGTGDIPVNTDPLSGDTAAGESAAATEPEAGTVPAGDEAPIASGDAAPADTAADTAVADTPPPPEPVTKPVKPSKPVVVAAKEPMSLTPTTPKAASGSGVLVQLSSQKSEDAARAAYGGLRKRFPGILGPYDPNIVRADLGDRGIYYRVRVGPFSGADATRLCEDLKAAGGDCIIAR